jgi:hypothetical protein
MMLQLIGTSFFDDGIAMQITCGDRVKAYREFMSEKM